MGTLPGLASSVAGLSHLLSETAAQAALMEQRLCFTKRYDSVPESTFRNKNAVRCYFLCRTHAVICGVQSEHENRIRVLAAIKRASIQYLCGTWRRLVLLRFASRPRIHSMAEQSAGSSWRESCLRTERDSEEQHPGSRPTTWGRTFQSRTAASTTSTSLAAMRRFRRQISRQIFVRKDSWGFNHDIRGDA